MTVKYQNMKVALTGEDGNAFSILGHIQKAMRRAKVPEDEIRAFMEEATKGDYDNLLRTCMEWVDVS